MSMYPPGAGEPSSAPTGQPQQPGTAQPGWPQQPGWQQPPPPPPPGYQQYQQDHWGPQNPATQFGQLAGFGTRLGGHLLDWLLYGLLFLIALVPGLILVFAAFDDCGRRSGEISCAGDEFAVGSFLGGGALILAGMVVVALVYLHALATTGQTWGRKIVGIKVVNERTGAPPGWGKALGRLLFASFISGQIFYIGYLWMLWDDKKQTLHDKVAGTHVIEA